MISIFEQYQTPTTIIDVRSVALPHVVVWDLSKKSGHPHQDLEEYCSVLHEKEFKQFQLIKVSD